ncbi:uncharacterized protein LOC118415774 [Branchiostoma floridae]|uniref:Uncharacterized protein LOC118415774 n=1 Tax=Branchiostoma floridae TaxID=7739 RepID=A0A9J7L6G5_BRAFL|nr:uncharacterized protein LOC118415774 [Branchiostoma floridae]
MDWASSHQILLLSAAGAGVAFYAARKYFGGGVCYSTARLEGKTAIVTGSNTGLGKETARDLARRGARVILACRNVTKAEEAAEDIRKTTGNGNVVVLKLDLSSLASVREFAAGINEKEERLDILINNAGIMMCPQWKTEDGFEMQFGTNHLGHFLLTNLLMDKLKKCAPSRVVTVSSMGHQWGKIHFDDINLENGYEPLKAYGQSKLANILFIRELAKKLEGTEVTCYAVHPGGVRSDLSRYMPDAHGRWLALVQPLVQLGMYVVGKSPEQGAQTSLHCALQEGLESKSGLYFSDCAPIDPSPAGQDDEVAKRLWEVSEEMVGLKNTDNMADSGGELEKQESRLVVFAGILVGVAGVVLMRKYFGGGVCRSTARLDGKTVVITGANTGIGKETARDIAKRGARVILACRDLTKAEAAAAEIRQDTGNGNVVTEKMDLASLKSVREFALKVNARESRLDILINNAGIMACPQWKTEDGFEMQFGTNHLGHFLLTNLLLDKLKKSAPSRVVNVSSGAHEQGAINFDDINLERTYTPWGAYGQSKLANVLFTKELDRKLKDSGVTTYSLHPGVINTELSRNMDAAFGWGFTLLSPVLSAAVRLFGKSVQQGAQTTIHCAVTEGLEGFSGQYFA